MSLRTVLVGAASRVAGPCHRIALARCAQVNVVGYCDNDLDLLAAVGAEDGVSTLYRDFNQVLADEVRTPVPRYAHLLSWPHAFPAASNAHCRFLAESCQHTDHSRTDRWIACCHLQAERGCGRYHRPAIPSPRDGDQGCGGRQARLRRKADGAPARSLNDPHSSDSATRHPSSWPPAHDGGWVRS